MNKSTYSPDSNEYGVPSVGQFDRQHLIVIVFRGILDFNY